VLFEEIMKKSVIALSISSAILSPASFAEHSNNTKQLSQATEVMVITASRSPQQQFDVLAAVDVFDQQTIAQLQPSSVADLLSRLAGITVTSQGTAAHQTSVFVRGSNSDHMLILVDGIRVGSATLGEKNLADIPLPLIERIEVVRGPRAALWGSDAIGGVVQIFTRQLTATESQVGFKMGHHNMWQTYAAFGLGNSQHQYTLSASAEASQGFDVIRPAADNPYAVDQADNDGYRRAALALNGSSQITDSFDLSLVGQYNQGKTEIDAVYTGDETFYQNHQIALTGNWQLSQARVQATVANASDDNHDNGATLYQGAINNRYKTSRQQANLLVEIPLSANAQLVTGVDWYQEEVNSSNDYAKTKRNAAAWYLTGRQHIAQLKLEASVRHDSVGDSDSETTYQLATGYDITDHWLVAFTHGTAFKAPTFNDLYWPLAFGSGGNPNLVSETATTNELLTKYDANDYALTLSVYQTEFDNLIEWAPIDSEDPFSGWQPSNINQAKVKGAELTLQAQLFGANNSLTLSHIEAKNSLTNQQMARRPHFSANYSISYQLANWDLSANINHQGKRMDSNGSSLTSHSLVNLTARLPLTSQLTLFANITNLTDKDYMQISEYPGDKRGYSLAFDYRF
jgi:vitamin B12 transporter